MTDTILIQDALVEFLRARLDDPRNDSTLVNNRIYTSKTETFTASSDTTFSLNPDSTMQWLDSVQVGSTTKTKWQDYWIDFQNQKVTFYSSVTGTVTIKYHQGTTNWIYPDRPSTKLSRYSFPRISVDIIDGTATRLGQYNSDIESYTRFQINIFTKESQQFTINNRNYEGEGLAYYFGNKILEAFRNHESDLHPLLYSYETLRTPSSLGLNIEYQAFHVIVEVGLNTINQGEV